MMKQFFFLSSLALSFILRSQLLLHEPFDYVSSPTNGLAAQSAGAWVKINTGDSILVGAGSLSYPGLPSSIGNKATYDAGGADYYTSFAPQSSGTIYASFILNVPSLGMLDPMGSYGMNFIEANSTSVFGACVWFQTSFTPGKYVIGISNKSSGSMPIYSGVEMNTNETYFVVISYNIVPGAGNDYSKMWINPTQFGGTEPMAMYVSSGGTDIGAAGIGRFLLRQANNTLTPYVEIDELRIGTTWASVTPQFVAPCQTYDTLTTTACSSYTLNGQTYTTSGTYAQTLVNAQGCDSLLTINLTINYPSSSTESMTSCGPFNWFNQDYAASGTYVHTLTNAQGCDSILTLNLTVINPIGYYTDIDQDGFGNDTEMILDCVQPPNTVTVGGDCDDMDNSIYPGAPEICDGMDNNCDGQVDEGLTFLNYYFDGDGDGFGIGNSTSSCSAMVGFVTQDGDCDDSNNAVYPGAPDTQGNGIDENCDGVDGILGLNSLDLSAQISPNPTTGEVKISFNNPISASLILTDLSGKILFENAIDGMEYLLDLSSLTSGTYLISIQSQVSYTIQRIVKL